MSRVAFVAALVCLAFVEPSEASATAASPFAHQTLGQCYESELGALTAIDENEAKDPNIVAVAADVSDESRWVIDKTAGHNYQWFLLERQRDRYCVTLFVPFAAEVNKRSQRGVLAVIAKTQTSPGGPAYTMQFRRSKKTQRFVPFACETTMFSTTSTRGVTRSIDCARVGD